MSVLKTLVATVIAGVIFVAAVSVATGLSEMSLWFWMGTGSPVVLALLAAIPFGVVWGASTTKTTTLQGVMIFLGIIALLAVIAWGFIDGWLRTGWDWSEIGWGAVSLIGFLASATVIHLRATTFK